MKDNYRTMCALIAWVVLSLRFVDMLIIGEYSSIAETLFVYFGYFTVWANILVALAFTAPLLNPDRKLSNFLMRPGVRAALASYILMVSVVYHVMIVPYWNPQGFTWLTATGLNTVMPILYIIDWLFFAEKRPIFYKHLPYWLIFPAVYGATSIVRGLLTNVYPYPFLNVADLGIGNVLLNMSGLVAVFAVVGPIFIAVGHLISDRTKA
ncbi:Pr6Pr family membrane protein [Gammaproteobacteria bacterium]|nr:Pr6Pr family membrane protein [Gammaproteobacteria bacterium]